MGVTYYVDFTNGHDTNNDGTTPTKSNGDGPWKTIAKAFAALTAGDKAIVRRGMTDVYGADLSPTADGTPVAPITLEADYDDAWSDFAAASHTATFIFGSKTVTFADDVSGDLAVGDWIFNAAEDPREFAYEIAVVAAAVITLYLPYKGTPGAGKTVTIMPDAPISDSNGGDFSWVFSGDQYWKIQGMSIISDDTTQAINVSSEYYFELKDCYIYSATDNAADYGVYDNGADGMVFINKCRITAGRVLNSFGGFTVKDSLLTAIASALYINGTGIWSCSESELISSADIVDAPPGVIKLLLRNCPMTAVDKIVEDQTQGISTFYFEDYDGTVGDNRQARLYATADDTFHIVSDAVNVRGGGGVTSIAVTPDRNMSTIWEQAWFKLFEYPIYQVKDVAVTYTVYFRSADDTDWDNVPTAAELWIEAEYWGHATNVSRRLVKSTGTCANFAVDDTVWDTLTVTFTPLITGVVYLRGYYAKTKEATNANLFYCDTKVVVS